MNANAFRHFYDYNFAENRKIWEHYVTPLSQEQFTQNVGYSHGDEDLILWQVLLHVVNHGTDHRAQLLRLLNDLGVRTTSQDYIFYVYENLSLFSHM